MQWGQIKTLFILCFLVLNIFLFQQFLVKKEQSELGSIPESTIEDKLAAEHIVHEDLPEGTEKESYITAKRKQFTEKDIENIGSSDNQEVRILNGNVIASEFEDPIPLNPESTDIEIAQMMKEYVKFSDKYVFWQWNKDLNTIIFFQKYNNKPIYYNQGGLLLITLNEDNEMVSYVQTLLEDIEPQGEEKELVKPLQAVETLYYQSELLYEDEITEGVLGYHTLVLNEAALVFAPTWKISVNEERSYFVNAVLGNFFASNDINFIKEAKANLLEQTNVEPKRTTEQAPETETETQSGVD